MSSVDTHGRRIAAPEFPDDDGAASAAVAAALAAYDRDPSAGDRPLLAELQDARVLVPVVATLGQMEYDDRGLAQDKSSDMAAVLMTGRDGRTALLCFSSTETMQAWNPEARPVAVSTRLAARAALQDGADALLVDVAGPVLFPVEGQDLRDLADGLVLRRLDQGWGWTRTLEGEAGPAM
jgi:hypothetical protein